MMFIGGGGMRMVIETGGLQGEVVECRRKVKTRDE